MARPERSSASTNAIRDKFSARRRAINEGVAELARAYEAKYGQAPSAYVLTLISEHVTSILARPSPITPRRESNCSTNGRTKPGP